MKLLAGLLGALIAAPLQGRDLQLFLIPDTPAHLEAWRTIEAAARRAGVGVQMRAVSAERGMVLANEGQLDGAIGRTMLAARGYAQLVAVRSRSICMCRLPTPTRSSTCRAAGNPCTAIRCACGAAITSPSSAPRAYRASGSITMRPCCAC